MPICHPAACEPFRMHELPSTICARALHKKKSASPGTGNRSHVCDELLEAWPQCLRPWLCALWWWNPQIQTGANVAWRFQGLCHPNWNPADCHGSVFEGSWESRWKHNSLVMLGWTGEAACSLGFSRLSPQTLAHWWFQRPSKLSRAQNNGKSAGPPGARDGCGGRGRQCGRKYGGGHSGERRQVGSGASCGTLSADLCDAWALLLGEVFDWHLLWGLRALLCLLGLLPAWLVLHHLVHARGQTPSCSPSAEKETHIFLQQLSTYRNVVFCHLTTHIIVYQIINQTDTYQMNHKWIINESSMSMNQICTQNGLVSSSRPSPRARTFFPSKIQQWRRTSRSRRGRLLPAGWCWSWKCLGHFHVEFQPKLMGGLKHVNMFHFFLQ